MLEIIGQSPNKENAHRRIGPLGVMDDKPH